MSILNISVQNWTHENMPDARVHAGVQASQVFKIDILNAHVQNWTLTLTSDVFKFKCLNTRQVLKSVTNVKYLSYLQIYRKHMSNVEFFWNFEVVAF